MPCEWCRERMDTEPDSCFMTLSQRKLVCFFTLFIALEAAFQSYLFFSAKNDFVAFFLGALFFDFVIGGAIGGLTGKPWIRYIGWVIIALVVAVVCSGPHNLLAQSGEAHGWALMIFHRLFLWGLTASGIGTLFGFLLRRFLTPK